MTTQKKRRSLEMKMMMMKKRKSMTGRSLNQNWNLGVVDVWWVTPFVSFQEVTAVKRRMKKRIMMRMSMTCRGRTVTLMVQCSIEMKTRMRMRTMSPQQVRIVKFEKITETSLDFTLV